MLNLMKTELKIYLRNRQLVFWPLVFPLILGTLLFFAVGNIGESDFKIVPVAVVETGTENEIFYSYLNGMAKEEEGDTPLLKVETMSESEALKALNDQKVEGIFYVDATPTLSVSGVGMPESILQTLLNSYIEGEHTLEVIIKTHPEGIEAAIEQMADYEEMIEEVSLGGKTINGIISFFYALIAMACLYGGFIGLGVSINLQANLSAVGARRCVASTHKLKIIISEMLVAFLLHFVNILILLVYLRYILKLDFQGNIFPMSLVCLVGGMIGVCIGIFAGSVGKWSEGIKLAIVLGVSMVSSYLAGLMNSNMKNMVEKSCPIINRINPAALISDAFYCINVYEDSARFARNLITMSIMCVVLLAASFFAVRRELYDSI